MKDRLRWVAARDGIAHASDGRMPRALCGVTATPTRFAWPAVARCPRCFAVAERDYPEEVSAKRR